MARPNWLNHDALAARVVGYLGLALLPIGLISLLQAYTSQAIAREQTELALVALTEQSVAPLARQISRAVGATETLALTDDLLLRDGDCDAVARLVAAEGPFDYVRLLSSDEASACEAGTSPVAVPSAAAQAAPGLLRVDLLPGVNDPHAIGIGVALEPDPAGTGEAAHLYATINLSLSELPSVPQTRRGPPLSLVLFRADGEPLAWLAAGGLAEPQPSTLPAGQDLASVAREQSGFFIYPSAGGPSLGYTVVPVAEGLIYALASWQPAQIDRPSGLSAQAPLAFPALMWTMSLTVAVWALGRLVVRPVRELARRMNLFGSDRTFVEQPLSGDLTRELREIDGVFREMASAVVRDEARMRAALDERSALLREVHHRVKNNLQLISSIISMQLRRSEDPDVRAILRRLQDRVLTLAAIYRSLYTSSDMTAVDVAPILREIVDRELDALDSSITATVQVDHLRLDADKVVPLVFLAAEAVSNAAVAAAPHDGGLMVVLRRDDDGHATLTIENPVAAASATMRRQGLGIQLMSAFAAQIGAPIRSGVENGLFRVSITFDVPNLATVATADTGATPVPAS